MKDIIKLGVTLAVICIVATLALALTNNFTSAIISKRQADDLKATLGVVLPGVDSFEAKTDANGATYYLATKGGSPAGAVFNAAPQGFGGPINMLVGFDQTGKITGVEIVSLSETPGVGMRTKEDPSFREQFKGKSVTDAIAVGQDVQALTGATVSSKAVTKGVRESANGFQSLILGQTPTAPVTPPAPAETPIDLTQIPDGTYQGSAEGIESTIKVQVTVSGGKLTEVKILDQKETPEVAGPALESLPKAMVEQQKVDVDVYTGATYTSKGIIGAVKNALPKPGAMDLTGVADGTYTGKAEGRNGEIEVNVTVAGGKVTEVKVVSQDETPEIAEEALTAIPAKIVETQSIKVDAVSGATLTSKGIMDAVQNALSTAK